MNRSSHDRQASVLIVEDEIDQRKALTTILRAQGHSVRSVANGMEAVEAARAQAPDIVILDVNLTPGIDGFETCQRLRDLRDPPPSILFLSACNSVSHTIKALDLGGVDYLSKPFDPDHLGARIRAAIRTRRELEDLRDRASQDPLTGLLNRGELETRGRHLVELGSRYNRPFSCLLLDVDCFKTINDTFGHAAGDQVLLRVASLIAGSCRKSDSVFRIGGDEFLVLTPETDAPTALALGKRIVATLQRESTAPRRPKDILPPTMVTLSIGVAAWTLGQTIDDVVRAADSAMYAVKAAGCNGVQSCRDGVQPSDNHADEQGQEHA